jgi:hypothetical protein
MHVETLTANTTAKLHRRGLAAVRRTALRQRSLTEALGQAATAAKCALADRPSNSVRCAAHTIIVRGLASAPQGRFVVCVGHVTC